MKQIIIDEELPCVNQVELQPCKLCSRTFHPNILPRHIVVCEKYAKKRRRVPFDSSSQRRKVTGVTSYLLLVNNNHDHQEINEKPPNNWRAKHKELLRAVRVARGVKDEDIVLLSTKSVYSQTCPVCNRNFTPKSYERHIQFCKEMAQRRYRKEKSATNANPFSDVELETKIKYCAPLLPERVAIIEKRHFPRTSSDVENAPIKATQPEKEFISTLHVEKVPASVLSVQPNREPLKQLNGHFERMIWKQTCSHSNVLDVSKTITTDQLQTLDEVDQKDSVKLGYKINEDIHLIKLNKTTSRHDNEDNSDSEILKRLQKESSNPLSYELKRKDSKERIIISQQNKDNMNLNNLPNIFETKNNGMKNTNTLVVTYPIFPNIFSNLSTSNNKKCTNDELIMNHDTKQLIFNKSSLVDEKKKYSLLKEANDFELKNPVSTLVSDNDDIKCSESWNSFTTAKSVDFQRETNSFTNLEYYGPIKVGMDGIRNKQKYSNFDDTKKLEETTSAEFKKQISHRRNIRSIETSSTTRVDKKNNQDLFKATKLPVLRNVQYKNKSISKNFVNTGTADALLLLKQNNQTFSKDTHDRGDWTTHSQDAISSVTTNVCHLDTNLTTKLKNKFTKTYKSKETGQGIKIPLHLPQLNNMKTDRSPKHTSQSKLPLLKLPPISSTRPQPTNNRMTTLRMIKPLKCLDGNKSAINLPQKPSYKRDLLMKTLE